MKKLALKLFQVLASSIGEVVLRHRLFVVSVVQLSLIVTANFAAFLLRFEGDIPLLYQERMLSGFPIVALVYGLGLWMFGVQRGLWRYIDLHDLGNILKVCLGGTAALYVVIHWVMGWKEYPRSAMILTGLIGLILLSGVRFSVRWFREWLHIVGPTARRVLIVGAGNAGELLVRDLKTNPSYNYKPVAFVDDDPFKRRAKIHGIPVLGNVQDIAQAVVHSEAQEILVALPSVTPQLLQQLLEASEACRVPIKILPNVRQLLEGSGAKHRIRPLSLEDLLQREPIRTNLQELHPLLQGKRVLVTGAGGSIGSELCRQIACYRPSQLVLFERHENSVYALDLELRQSFPLLHVTPVVADVTNEEQVKHVFGTYAPDLIFHAAAHKHVPLMEHNASEAVRNNVLGTRVVAEAACMADVERFVLISTDKAVNPTSVMGATKHIAERLVQSMNQPRSTRFSVVRFGNVLGSNGSVVPLFMEQIRKGGPVTVTHPEIRRFFMTIPEAVQLVLQASVMGQGGDVFVLDMGEQIRVADLARNMIRLSGHQPDFDMKITYTGLRPGEKLYEELFEKNEQVESTSHDKIKRAVKHNQLEELGGLTECIGELERLAQNGYADDDIIKKLRELLLTYQQA